MNAKKAILKSSSVAPATPSANTPDHLSSKSPPEIDQSLLFTAEEIQARVETVTPLLQKNLDAHPASINYSPNHF